MKIQNKFIRLVTRSIPALSMMLLASCGSYSSTTPYTSQQSTSVLKGYPAISGRPALRTPSSIGIFHTNRTNALDFSEVGANLIKSGSIRSMQSINSLVNNSDYYQVSDVVAKRAKLIHDVKYLGLDVLIVCDQMTKTENDISIMQFLTLGILDFNLQKQDTQLTVLCIDARTGYIYGTMGQQEDGHAPKLSLFESNVFGNSDRSHLVNTTRRNAVAQFPDFWNQVVKKYRK